MRLKQFILSCRPVSQVRSKITFVANSSLEIFFGKCRTKTRRDETFEFVFPPEATISENDANPFLAEKKIHRRLQIRICGPDEISFDANEQKWPKVAPKVSSNKEQFGFHISGFKQDVLFPILFRN